MKKFFSYLLVLFLLTLFSCDQHETEIACDIKDPVKNLSWLKAKIDIFIQSKICENNACNMLVYKVNTGTQQLIVTLVTGPAVDGIPQYYTCNGELVICTGEEPCPNLNEGELIWKSNSN